MINSMTIRAYCENNGKTFSSGIELRDDGSGVYISKWPFDDLAEPTAEQLANIDTSISDAKLELSKLDAIIPRYVEDLVNTTSTQLFGSVLDAKTRKEQLRTIVRGAA